MIQRPEYLERLTRWRDKDVIKVITGMRRVGKSTIMELFQERLREEGVKDRNILAINFESYEEDYPTTSKELYDYIVQRLGKVGTTYVLLDEIQRIDEFERLLNALHVNQSIDLYITGSNAYFLSGDLATLLTGRYVELPVYPLSFKEYYSATKDIREGDPVYPLVYPYVSGASVTREQLFENYLTYGGLPYTAMLRDERLVVEYLDGVFNTIIVKDILQRRPRMNTRSFESTASFLADNVGNISSIKKIATGLASRESKVSEGAVSEYVDALLETYLLFKVDRFDLKGKEYLKTLEKYYLGDMGFRYWLLGKRAGDVGRRIENVVFLELKRRYPKVDIGKQGGCEVDFVATGKEKTSYFQVAQTAGDESTLKRELAPLQTIRDNHQKTLITLDTIGLGDIDGISQVNLIDWLLGED